MRKIILSVISTLAVIGLLLGGLLLYVRGHGGVAILRAFRAIVRSIHVGCSRALIAIAA